MQIHNVARLYLPLKVRTATITEHLTREIGGCTVLTGAGHWLHPDTSEHKREYCRVIECIGEDVQFLDAVLQEVARDVKEEYGEHTVIYTICPVFYREV